MSGDGDSGVQAALTHACQGDLSLPALAQQLTELGAFRGLGRDNAVARFSRHVLDALPKTHSAGAGGAAGDLLAEKLATHQLLLQVLGDAGALKQLHATVLRLLFEDGQRLAALVDVQQLESELHRGGAGGGGFALHDVVLAAGEACLAAVPGSNLDPWTLFYSCPTASVTQFFQAVAAAAGQRGLQPGRAAAEHGGVAQLAKALAAALGGAQQQRATQQQFHGAALNAAIAALDEPELAAGADVRIALAALADACCRLQPLLAREAPHLLQDSVALLFDLTDRLLNAGAAAVAAAPLGSQRRALHEEYAAVRDQLLAHLLRQAAALYEQDEAEGELQLSRVRGLSFAHAGYAQLFDLADLTGDREQLYAEMGQLRGDGLAPPLAAYVFGRLLAEGRRAELLDLPQQFDEELHAWLADAAPDDAAQRSHLLWLHELRMHEYGSAAATLERLVGEAAPGQQPRLEALQRLAALAAVGEGAAF